MQQRSRAIILRRVGYGEADWIVTFLCREHGRMSGIAKSARSSRRRFGGALESGTLVDLHITARGSSRLVRLEEAIVALPINGVLKSLERIGAMQRALALALAFVQERDPNPEKFDLLSARIRSLCEHEPIPEEGVAFELDWLARCGFGPAVAYCAACGRKADLPGRWYFEFDRGGIVCAGCGSAGGMRVPLSNDARLGFLSVSGFETGAQAAHAEAARAVLSRYIDHVLGRPLFVR
ncbi:MAG: DNA repair protein RecO [bacterium]